MTTDLERRLAAALAQEAEHAMTLTNTPQELQRFRQTVTRRTRRTRLVLVAASVVAVVGVAVAAARVDGGSSSRPAGPAPDSSVAQHELGDPTPVAGATTSVAGPFSTGDAALGAVWAISGDQTHGVLYRISEDGRQVLSRTPYDGSNPEHQQVTRVGSRVVVVNGAGTAYDLFDATGRQVGTVPAEQPRGAAGDATGGWLVTGAHAVTRVSATGVPTGLVATLPTSHLIMGVATGGGALWVLDVDGTLYRVDEQTGKVTGSSQAVIGDPLQVVWTQGAAFVTTNRYDVTRVDAATLKVTDVLNGDHTASYQVLTVGTDGSLWTNPAKGAVAELDPATLTVRRYVQAFPGSRQGGGAFGLAVTADRVFLSDGYTSTMHSFAR